jgi:hypothetical protein
MSKKFFIYALLVSFATTVMSWSSMADTSNKSGRGSGWTSRTSGGSSGGFGGHK